MYLYCTLQSGRLLHSMILSIKCSTYFCDEDLSVLNIGIRYANYQPCCLFYIPKFPSKNKNGQKEIQLSLPHLYYNTVFSRYSVPHLLYILFGAVSLSLIILCICQILLLSSYCYATTVVP